MNILRSRKQAGDTIVEVLVAIVIVAVVLVGAIAVSSNSTKKVRDNEEHSQALGLVQGQVESLNAYLVNVNATRLNADIGSGKYCMVADVPKPYSPANCPLSTIGGVTNVSPYFERSAATYTFKITWDSVTGGTGSERLIYRGYPGVTP